MGGILYTILIYPLTQIIEFVFKFCTKIVSSTPLALVGVSLAVSLLTLPLYIVAESWQQVEREKQNKMKPAVDKIKAVFHGNEQYMILSTYYRQQHYHPMMSLRSAFGLLIQIPFFTAAYSCLSNMSALQGKGFWLIKDLGAPDAIFSVGGFNVNILPIVMTIINIAAAAIYLRGLSLRDKIQSYGLALLFLVILYNSPAGLVIYWTMNNVFSLVKNVFYKMKHPVRNLYILACVAVTVLILWLFIKNNLSMKRRLLVCAAFSIVYFAPFFVRLANYLVDIFFTCLRDDFKKRSLLFGFSALSLCLLLGRLIPTLLISSSPMEFSNIDGYASPMFFVNNTFFQAIGLCLVWPCLVYFLFKERIQTLMAFGFFGVLVCALLNAFVFTGNYGTLSTLLQFVDVPNLDSPIKFIALNLAVMLAVFVFAAFLLKLNLSTALSCAAAFCAFALLGVSVSNSIAIRKSYAEFVRVEKAGGPSGDSIPKIFHLSRTGKNVVFIYLDRAQNKYIEPLFEESPELYEQYSGFTLYKNTVSYNPWTLLGSAPCFGGYEYTPQAMNERKDELLVDKRNQALVMLPRIFTEQVQDFSATVTDPVWANFNWVPDISIFDDYPKISAHKTDKTYLDKWYQEHKDTHFTITSDSLKRNILWYALLRTAPYVLRPAFYNDGNYWSTNSTNKSFDEFLAGYSAIDYLPEFTDFDSPTQNVYLNFSNETTHDSIFLQAPEYVPVAEVTDFGSSPYKDDESYHSMAAAIKRLGEWLFLLQQEGVYENCRIVIVSDHGGGGGMIGFENWDNKELNPESYHPLLMAKDFGESGSLKLNYDFMTNADAPSLVLQGVVDEAKNPFTGNEISSDSKKDGALICTDHLFMPYQTKSKYVFTVPEDSWYRVKENIFDSANWTKEKHAN